MFTNASADAARATMREVAAHGDDERTLRLTRHEALWNGQRHKLDPRPSFWDGTVPLRERAPAVQAMLVRSAGMRLVHMVAGERSFPTVDVSATGYRVTLSDGEREALQALAGELVAAACLSSRLRALLVEGLKTGSAVCVQSLSGGKPRVQVLPAKWCTATRDASGDVVRLVVQYKSEGAGGKLFVYRRVIGDGRDVAYEAIPADRLADPEFSWSTVREAHSRPIEFVAVSWTRNLVEAVEESHAEDGHALAEGLEDELDAIDLELSQLYRNALYNGEPQMVRTGVDPEKPAPPMGAAGREAAAGFSWFNSVLPAGWRGGNAATVQKAPGKLWNLPTGGDAKLLESTGAGAGIIGGALDRLTRVVTDAFGVVMVDPSTLGGGDLSARALTLLFGPQLDTADNLRVEYGAALVTIVSQLMRLCAGPAAAESGVRLTTWEAARPALAKCWATEPVLGPDGKPLPSVDGKPAPTMRAWNPPAITLRWGEYFEPSWADITAAVDAATKGLDGGTMSPKQAVALIAPLTGVVDQDAELAAIEAHRTAGANAVRSTLATLRDEPADDAPTVTDAGAVDVALPADATPATVDPATAKDPGASLNGAQVSSLLEIIAAVAERRLPRATGVAIITAAFSQTAEQADATMGEVGRTFFVEPAEKPAAMEPTS